MELEDRHKKFEELPENIQEALLAPETASSIYKIGKSANLTDEKISLLAELVGNVFMEASKNSDLTDEVKNGLGVSDDIAKNLSAKIGEVVKYIQSRPMEQITEDEEELERVGGEGEKNIEPEPAPEISPIKPTFAKNESLEFLRGSKPPESPRAQASTVQPQEVKSVTDEEPAHEAPLILHKEEEVEPAKETPLYSTQRPAFYKPTFSEEYKRTMEAESAARVELGEETKKAQPQTGRTSGEPSRIVHYSEFRTPLSPFEGTPSPEPQGETPRDMPAAQIHPNNVIDLKDLPLE